MSRRVALSPVSPEEAERGARVVMEDARKQMGMIPNMYARMANAPELLATYAAGYSGFRLHSGFTAVEQEVVFLTISVENECTYCVAAHSLLADQASGVPEAVTDAIRAGRLIDDRRLRVLQELTLELIRSRGWPSQEKLDAFREAGYSDQQVLYLVLAIATKLISNYTNHLLETPLDAAFSTREWTPSEG